MKSNFITQKFVNRVSPSFMTAKEFLINADSPVHRIKIYIRGLTDYLLFDETLPPGTCDYKIEFDNFFSTFNTMSIIEFILIGNYDQKIHASLSYRDYNFPIVPVKNLKKIFLCLGPSCSTPFLNRQMIYAENSQIIVEPFHSI